MTDDTEDLFRQLAWSSFLEYAVGEPRIREQFTRETGIMLVIPRNAMEETVDQATGAAKDTMRSFVEWATIFHYGLEYAPQAFQDAIAKKRA